MPAVMLARGSDTARLRCELEKELHDGPALRASALAVELGLLLDDAEPDVRHKLAGVQESMKEIINDLRELGQVLYPAVLAGQGVRAALRAVAEHRGVLLGLDVDDGRMSSDSRSHACLFVADHLRAVPRGTAVLVRIRGSRRLTRIQIDHTENRQEAPTSTRAVLLCA